MYEPNAQRITELLGPSDVVLDIGGWGRPFNRADWVVDQEPYATRGLYGTPQGGTKERFSESTWIQKDICAIDRLPFEDKEIDFVICSHTLEDLRDPLRVCAEMLRVGKAGYIEVPSRIAESCRGVEPGQVGWSHHRWLIDIEGESIRFMMKYHKIHSHWRLSFPRRFLRGLAEEQRVQWLFWQGSFSFSELTLHGVDTIETELERYVERQRPYPRWLLAVDRAWRTAVHFAARGRSRLSRELARRLRPSRGGSGEGGRR